MEEQDVMALSLEGGEASQISNPMADLLDDCGRIVPERGETIEGVLVRIDPTEIVVDIGCKSEGIVTSRDLERLDPKFRKSLRVATKCWFMCYAPRMPMAIPCSHCRAPNWRAIGARQRNTLRAKMVSSCLWPIVTKVG